MNVGGLSRIHICMTKQPRDGRQRKVIVTNPHRGSCMAVHMCSDMDSGFLLNTSQQRANSRICQRATNFPFPQVHEDVIRQMIGFKRSQILNQVCGVELHERGGDRNAVALSCFCSGTVRIVVPRDNPNFIVFRSDVLMTKSERLPDPYSNV